MKETDLSTTLYNPNYHSRRNIDKASNISLSSMHRVQTWVTRLISAFFRDAVPHAATRRFHVASIPRDDVAVKMHDRLTRCLSAVHPYVVAMGNVTALYDELSCSPYHQMKFLFFFRLKLEIIRSVVSRYQENVAG